MSNESNPQARLWSMLCHLTALSMLIGVPFGNLLGPLVIWLVKRNEIPEVDFHGKESLNFQLSMTLYGFLVMIVALPLTLLFIGFLLVPLVFAIAIVDAIFVVIASIQANDGTSYRYPLTIRFIT